MENQNIPQNETTPSVVDKKSTNDSSFKATSIENVAENGGVSDETDKPKPFLTKKKVILTIIFLLISFGFVVVTVRPILKVDWNQYNTSVGIGIAKNIGWLWLFLILVQLIVNFNRTFFTMIPRLKKWGYKIPYKDYFLYSITIGFVVAVSPANIISDPYTIFWLKTHGVPTSKAASMFFSNTLLWQIAQIIVTMPFFGICCANSDKLTTAPADRLLFAMICIGVIIDFIGLAFFLLLNWSKNFHYFCSRLFNWFKKKLHMKYHTKEETIAKYKEKAVMKQDFISSMKDWKTTGIILMWWIVGDILGLLALVYSMFFVQNVLVTYYNEWQIVTVNFDIGRVLMCARLSVPANRLNILPGQAMGYEAALVRLLNVYGGWNIQPSDYGQATMIQETVVRNSVLSGKIFFSWLPAVIGIGGFVVLTKQQIKLSNEGKLLKK